MTCRQIRCLRVECRYLQPDGILLNRQPHRRCCLGVVLPRLLATRNSGHLVALNLEQPLQPATRSCPLRKHHVTRSHVLTLHQPRMCNIESTKPNAAVPAQPACLAVAHIAYLYFPSLTAHLSDAPGASPDKPSSAGAQPKTTQAA